MISFLEGLLQRSFIYFPLKGLHSGADLYDLFVIWLNIFVIYDRHIENRPVCCCGAVDDVLLSFIASLTESTNDWLTAGFLIAFTVHRSTSKFENSACIFETILEEVTLSWKWAVADLFGFWLVGGVNNQRTESFVPHCLFWLCFPGWFGHY